MSVGVSLHSSHLHTRTQPPGPVHGRVRVGACVSGLDVLMQSHLHPRDSSPGRSTHQFCIAILKKPITSSPSDLHRPLVDIKRPTYTDLAFLKLFFKGKILVCALALSKARRHSREPTRYIKVTQEQEDTSSIEGVAKIKARLAWTTLGCLAPLIFVYWITNSVTCCQATPRPPFNWRWHVSHRGLTSPMYKHGVQPSRRMLWRI